jgi:hypothetical protein
MTLESLALIYKSPVWLATVIDQGGDVLQVGVDAGYAHVVGATTQKDDAEHCRERFKNTPVVRIFNEGDDIVLHEVIKDINVPVTFCLDSRSEPPPALIQELGVLKHHRIKTHTILIRNVSLFGKPESGMIEWPQVREVVRRINEGYRFTAYPECDVIAATFP